MDPMYVTGVAMLTAVAVVFAITEVVVCVGLLTGRDEADPTRLLIGLVAGVATHLSLYALSHSLLVAALGLVPIAATAAIRTPRTWRPPPRLARPAPETAIVAQPVVPGMVAGDDIRWNRKLTAREEQVWESIRRSLDEGDTS